MIFNIKKYIQSESGIFIVSILLGLGLASLFRKACNDRQCLVFNAIPYEQIKEKIYKFGNDCYQFERVPETCNNQKKKITYNELNA